MKYRYATAIHQLPDGKTKFFHRPLVEIEIFGNRSAMKAMALVDSGADVSMFSMEIARQLDLDLASARRTKTAGITGVQETFETEITIQMKDSDEKIKITVQFIDSPYVGVLLGQEKFFDLHKIKFERDHKTFEITRVKK